MIKDKDDIWVTMESIGGFMKLLRLRRVWREITCMHRFQVIPNKLGMLKCVECGTEGWDQATFDFQKSVMNRAGSSGSSSKSDDVSTNEVSYPGSVPPYSEL